MPRTQKTGKRKTDKPPRKGQPPQGVVAWDVQVTNQDGELVASYDILTLVLKRPGEGELDV
jgi:oxepin-CoA hydrolase/3-oxo-5,6-dehydrosuberyl-CoA semialdehyde dehydrogenase